MHCATSCSTGSPAGPRSATSRPASCTSTRSVRSSNRSSEAPRAAYPAIVTSMQRHGGDGRGHAHDHRAASRRALGGVLALTVGFTVVEVVGGFLTDSLALLADAGHMLSDTFAIGLAVVALTLAARPSTPRRSFGFQRAEII